MTEEEREDGAGDLRALLTALVGLGADLDLDAILSRVVAAACSLTGARHGLLGILDEHGEIADVVARGSRPTDGETADEPRSRLDALVLIRDEAFGTLHVAGKRGRGTFTDGDERLLAALAQAAGYVIDNARAYALSERRREWLEATVEVSEAMHGEVSLEHVLDVLVRAVRRVSRADGTALVLPDRSGTFEVRASDLDRGTTARVRAAYPHLRRSIAGAVRRNARDMLAGEDGTCLVVLPLWSTVAVSGVLLILLPGSSRTATRVEDELLVAFAEQASVVVERAQTMAERAELLLAADRSRIARDLHDVVIQRLFATGLQLQGVSRVSSLADVHRRIDGTVQDLDDTIRDIRTTIFELERGRSASLRADVLALVREYAGMLGHTPTLRIDGPLDTAVDRETGDHALATLREALSNVARHARASASDVDLEVTAHRLTLRICDDGVGLGEDAAESGLRNVRRRAEALGGGCSLSRRDRGTALAWWVPLP